MAIPTIPMQSLVQPVAAMLRNSLIATGPLLKEVDFSHLEMRIPLLTDSESQVNAQVLVKPSSNTHYKLESKQVFVYTRISAETALTKLNFTDRTLPKSDYQNVVNFLANMGTFTTVSGDINDPKGDAVVTFRFGTEDDRYSARYIDLGNDQFRTADFGLAFYGTVKFTFLGQASTNDPVANEEEQAQEEDPIIDISPYFVVQDLGPLQDYLLR